MNEIDREVKPWTPWPLSELVDAAVYNVLIHFHPRLILTMISTRINQFYNLSGLGRRRLGRRERVLAWLNKVIPDKNIPNIQIVWSDASILCEVIDKTLPGIHFSDRSSFKVAQNMAFLYLGVIPAFTEEELGQKTFYPHLERRLVRYLSSLLSAITHQKWLFQAEPPSAASSCLARGMGLITANQCDPAHFYLYLVDSNFSLGDISVEIQSNQDFGFARIDNKYATTLPRKFANIPMTFVLNSNSLRINYIPQNSGSHQLSIFRKGTHIQGSPFSVAVEKISARKNFKSIFQETGRTPRKKLRVLLRIVDFVTEKMLLTDDGKLKSISPQDFLAFQRDKCRCSSGFSLLRQESVSDVSSEDLFKSGNVSNEDLLKPSDDSSEYLFKSSDIANENLHKPSSNSELSHAIVEVTESKSDMTLNDTLDSLASSLHVEGKDVLSDINVELSDQKLELTEESDASQPLLPEEPNEEKENNQDKKDQDNAKCSSIPKSFEFRNRCKKVIAACHFIMNHGSQQKRDNLLKTAGHLFDGRPVKLDDNIEQLLNIFPDIKTETSSKEFTSLPHEMDTHFSCGGFLPYEPVIISSDCSLDNKDSGGLQLKPTSNEKVYNISPMQNIELDESVRNANQKLINQCCFKESNKNTLENEGIQILDDSFIKAIQDKNSFLLNDCVHKKDEVNNSILNRCNDLQNDNETHFVEHKEAQLMFAEYDINEFELKWYNYTENENFESDGRISELVSMPDDTLDTSITCATMNTPLSSDSLDTGNQGTYHEPFAGPISSSSPCLNNEVSFILSDNDVNSSENFTSHVTADTQFHLWPSDVAFGEISASNFTSPINLDTMNTTTALKEALLKLEHNTLKRLDKSNDIVFDNSTNVVSSVIISNLANNSQENEEVMLITFDDNYFDSTPKSHNEVPLPESHDEKCTFPKNIHLITSNLETNDKLQSLASFYTHDHSDMDFSEELCETASHIVQEENMISLGVSCDDLSSTSDVKLIDYDVSNGIGNNELVTDNNPVAEACVQLQQEHNVEEPIVQHENGNGRESSELGSSSCEENQSPFPDSDSAYLSIDDIQSSSAHSPDDRATEDSSQWIRQLNENYYRGNEVIEWRNTSMGLGEKEVLGICDEEPEDSLHPRNFRLLTPVACQMAAIIEEEEHGSEIFANIEQSESHNNSLWCEQTYMDNSKLDLSESATLHSFGTEAMTRSDTQNKIATLQQIQSNADVTENSALFPNDIQPQGKKGTPCNISTPPEKDEDILLNFIYLDNKKQIIEFVDKTYMNVIEQEVNPTISENIQREKVFASSVLLLTKDLNDQHVETTKQHGFTEKHVCEEKTTECLELKEEHASFNCSVETPSNLSSNHSQTSDSRCENWESQADHFTDGFPVAMKVKLRKEFWDKKLLGCQQMKFNKPHFSNKIMNSKADLSTSLENSSLALHKATGNVSREVYSQVNMSKIVKKWRNAYHIKNDTSSSSTETTTTDEKCHQWNKVLERSVTPPPKVRSPSLHHARPALVREELDEHIDTEPSDKKPLKLHCVKDLVNQDDPITSQMSQRFPKINKDEICSRFEKAKQFFQTLEHNCTENADLKTRKKDLSCRRKGKSKKQCKANSAPSSDSETASRTSRPTLPLVGGSERIKVSERFHVRNLFKDVIGDSDDGFMKGIPHRAAVLEALRSMELERPSSPYEDADYCCPHIEYNLTEKTT